MTDFLRILQQAQELSGRIKAAEEELRGRTVSGSAGGGLVSAEVDGRGRVQRVRIDPSLVRPEDVEMIEDLVAAAISDAQKKAEEMMQETMGRVTGGLQLPFKLPF
jgi:DNA-binding YbaB/EbfC family protein